MTKQELLEAYTPEQLADMIVDLKTEISAKDSMLKMKHAKCEILDDNVLKVTCDKCGEKFIAFLEDKYLLCTKAKFFGMDEANRQLNADVDKLKTTINQIDDILDKLFGVTHDVTKTPDEFEKILKEKIENSKTIEDFLPTEPIEVASMLTNVKIEPKSIENGAEVTFYKRKFNILELRQVAEHLLIYCNANESE